jgi:hypothetical protein
LIKKKERAISAGAAAVIEGERPRLTRATAQLNEQQAQPEHPCQRRAKRSLGSEEGLDTESLGQLGSGLFFFSDFPITRGIYRTRPTDIRDRMSTWRRSGDKE